ncbi:MAG: DUF4437 domain-containing protein [Pseudomonadota bacterium]
MRVSSIARFAFVAGGFVIGMATANAQDRAPQAEVVSASELSFISLNPARGDAAPQAGVLWGDIRKDVPSGVLLRFAPGFTSPPHIHNITYRAVVISGALYNGSENATKMWMSPGSFWTQPAGEPHITAGTSAGGATAFLEIMSGPYLVQPTAQAFDNGERPVNVEARNVVWLSPSDVTWVNASATLSSSEGAQLAFLWGSPGSGKMNGTFLKLPQGYSGALQSNEAQLRAVVIGGRIDHEATGRSHIDLRSGSYFGSKGRVAHRLSCTSSRDCIIYVRTNGRYVIKPDQS